MMNFTSRDKKNLLEKGGAVLFALGVWQAAAMLLDEELFLVTPVAVAVRLAQLLPTADFASSLAFSFSRIMAGFFLALLSGSLLAVAAGHSRILEAGLWPFMHVVKSVPVASFIILCLIWLSSKSLSIFIGFLMVLPVIYTNMLHGIKSTDAKLLEMAALFRVGWRKKMKYIHLPHLKPYILSACSVSVGLAWKAGIAAEVIGIPDGSVGERLYEAKVYLSTADLFAWTAVIVVVSVIFERVFLWVLKKAFERVEKS